MSKAQLCEVFSSIQGEGIYLGERQVFIRFSGCNILCEYCDTVLSLELTPEYKFEQTPGKRDFKLMPNPVSAADLILAVLSLAKQRSAIHSVCITGGEPLLQVDFLKEFLPELKKLGIKIFLETNGTLPKHLEEVIDIIDIVSMDMKVPSATGGDFYLKEHKEFLETAYTKEVYVKTVVSEKTTVKEIEEISKLISSVDPAIPLVIQPVSQSREKKHTANMQLLFALQIVAKKDLINVRVIPQIHKILGAL
ncbi:7-carboxy-7-deazaguanine synthase QueE [Candidatus Saganbacteria bacterium]|nr:7-carboxy-7-deazaguanine synthase QueE [Candidatus Saganbacteria bacterium]